MRVFAVLAVLIVGLVILIDGMWGISSSLGQEYAYWVTGALRDVTRYDHSADPPLPLVEAGGRPVQVGRGTISWWTPYGDGWQGIEGDTFMTTPQLARFLNLETHIVPWGTAVTIEFPLPASAIVLSRWKFGREVESTVIPCGYTFIPDRMGTHIFGLHVSVPWDPDGTGSGSAHYAFIIRVR